MSKKTLDLHAGVLIHGSTTFPHGSATFRLIAHEGLTLENCAEGWRRLIANDATAFYGAIYTEGILANGWGPHAQPSYAAYLPLQWDELRCAGASGAMTFFAQIEPRRGSFKHDLHDDQQDVFALTATTPAALRVAARTLAAATGTSPREVLALFASMLRARESRLTRAA